MNAVIIAIGDELLNGQTTDTNSSWIAAQLNKIGVELVYTKAVKDEIESITEALGEAKIHSQMILTTGGLGPTEDDITKKAIARYLDDHLIFHEEMYDKILKYFERIQHVPTEAHKRQCYLPSSAELLNNSKGTAPGMWMMKDGTHILSMPGVPYEMKSIMVEGGIRKIQSLISYGQAIEHFVIQTAGMGETHIASKIEDLINEFPEELSIAYLPSNASVRVRISGKGPDQLDLKNLVKEFGIQVVERLGRAVYGTGELSLSQAVGLLCNTKKIKIATAESCTGGLVAHMITETPGASAYYEGSIVSYSNDLKKKVLGVQQSTLDRFGAVSEETVVEMVKGTLKQIKVDVAVSVSGIAGPSGGTPEKPVGTVWIAVGDKRSIRTKKLQLAKNRSLNIQYSAIRALNQLRLFIEECM